ncbi:MAG: hypothetical protein Q8P25_03960 [Candidatus Curtissbacteria bacterium]|nr:hypothetical protein [Candidatus Curtissbacteria bacterium]
MSAIKFIQVNIYKGAYLENLLDFLEEQEPDVVSMQEVSSGKINVYQDKTVNLFDLIRDKLGYRGVYNGDLKLQGDPGSTFGNAVLTKLPVLGSHIKVLHDFRPLTMKEIEGEPDVWMQVPRHVLDLMVEVDGRKVHTMSWHGAWTAPPQDTDETIRQAKLIAEYLISLNEPFILGCDSNELLQSETIQTINQVAINIMEGSGILQTTHPKIHKIVPRGFLIDYIFTSRDIKVNSLEVPPVTVSDHLPVVAELEL